MHVCISAPILLLFFFFVKEKEYQRELVFHCWKFKWNWKVRGLDCLIVPVCGYETEDGKSNYPFLSHAHTHTHGQVQRKGTLKYGLSNVLILCLLSLIWDEMSASLLPRCSSPFLVFCPTGHINYPLMNDTENRNGAYHSYCTVSAIHLVSENLALYDSLHKALLISERAIIKALLMAFYRNVTQ